MRPEIIYNFDGERIVRVLDKDELTIGRDVSNDIVIKRPSISRRHARIHRTADGWRVTDVGSMCGTRVNDLEDTDRTLADGDRIFLHRFQLLFRDRSAGSLTDTGPGVDLTSTTERPEAMPTLFQNTVDFKALASSPTDVQRLHQLLAIVTKASEALLVATSLDETFERVLDLVFDRLPVQRGFIMLWDEESGDLVTRCVKYKDQAPGHEGPIRFSRTIAEKVFREKVAVLTADAQLDQRFASGGSIHELGIRSAMAAPLWRGEQVDGLIYADTLRPSAYDKFDLDLLSALGNQLAVAIQQARLQRSVMQQQLVRRRLERYHSPAVVARIAAAHEDAEEERLTAEERDVTVLFADVVEFTRRCEAMEPRQIADMLNHYFSEMAERIFRHEGTLDKFIGDCIMAVFGAPISSETHATQAAEAVLEMREALDALNAPLPAEERVQIRVGLHSGRVVAGDIGSVRRSDYTVLGATVNLAARLESLVARPGQIVISDATRSALPEGRFETRDLGEQTLKGISGPVRCWELVGVSR